MTQLSASGSYMILNFLDNGLRDAAKSDNVCPMVRSAGWSNEEILRYGEPNFNFGRFPEGEDPASTKYYGFALYDFEN